MAKGRPTVFSKEVCNKILKAIQKGYSDEEACGYAGVAYSTYKNWKKESQDHKTNTPKKCFFQEVESAKSKREYVLNKPIIEAIVDENDVKVALKYLELREKARIAREANETQRSIATQEVEITDDDVEWINHAGDYN